MPLKISGIHGFLELFFLGKLCVELPSWIPHTEKPRNRLKPKKFPCGKVEKTELPTESGKQSSRCTSSFKSVVAPMFTAVTRVWIMWNIKHRNQAF